MCAACSATISLWRDLLCYHDLKQTSISSPSLVWRKPVRKLVIWHFQSHERGVARNGNHTKTQQSGAGDGDLTALQQKYPNIWDCTVFATYLDWANTPMTSAYRSATVCMLPVFGPWYLHNNTICLEEGSGYTKGSSVEPDRAYPSLYLKCLKAKVMTSLTKLSRTGWSGI